MPLFTVFLIRPRSNCLGFLPSTVSYWYIPQRFRGFRRVKLGVVVELSLLVEGQEMLDILFQPQSSNKKYDYDMVYVLFIYSIHI